MPPFKTILFAADFSQCSQNAFRVACALAREVDARIHVLHVVEALQTADGPVYFNQQTVQFLTAERDQALHDSLKERLRRFYVPDRPIETDYEVRDGLPTEVILRAANEAGCDLIVLGTHGRTGLSRVLTGSVAESILRRARCPVLALHSSAHGTDLPQDVQAILAPTDDSDLSRGALRIARRLARDLGARLVLLHVVPTDVVIVGDVPMPVDLQACRESLETLRKRLDGPDLKSPVETVLRQGDAATEILSAAQTTGSDLIVMGTHGRTGLPRLLMGSVAEAILRRSNCPVLMIRPCAPIADSTSEAGSSLNPDLEGDPVELTWPAESPAGV